MNRAWSWLLSLSLLSGAVYAQDLESLPPNGIQLDQASKQRWKVGLIVTAPGGPCGGIYGTATVPTSWPEQSVRMVAEDLSPEVADVKYRTLDNGVKQMLVSIPALEAGKSAHALVTFEVVRHATLAPGDTQQFVLPSKLPREIGKFLAASPYIETRHPKVMAFAKELAAQHKEDSAWQFVEAVYDEVRQRVEYVDGSLKGAAAALQDGTGDCEELTSLFIAACRINKIPARTVWVPGHCYPEFYLQDQNGAGHWIPCQAAGTRDFGNMPDTRPILQKGDNFRVPEKKEPQRYVAEFLSVKSVRGTGKPAVQFVRELLPAE